MFLVTITLNGNYLECAEGFKKVEWLGCSWLPCTQRDPVERVVDVWKDVKKVGRVKLA